MTALQKLIYGDRNLFVSSVQKEEEVQINNQMNVVKFLISLNKLGYSISNMEELFFLSADNFNTFEIELSKLFEELQVNGFIFRKSFAKSVVLEDYNNEDIIAMMAQYSITYGNIEVFKMIFATNPIETLANYLKIDEIDLASKIKTDNKTFSIDFEFEKTVEKINKSILESKIVIRDHQIEILKNTPSNILKSAYFKSNIKIKESEIIVINLLIDIVEPESLFKDMDQIVRFIVSNYIYSKDSNNKLVKINVQGQINNSILKHKVIKIPTKIKKAIIKSLNTQKDVDYTVEKMFKYYGFWKKILTAARFESEAKTFKKFPTYKLIKDALYKNDRRNTFNGKIEKFKQEGDYNSALKVLSTNPGFMLRNILEYLRYKKDVSIAKTKSSKEKKEYYFDDYYEELLPIGTIEDIIKEKINNYEEPQKEEDKRVSKVIIDASEFLNSPQFVDVLSKTNTKLLWQLLSLLKSDVIYEDRSSRFVQGVYINYSIPLPKVDKKIADVLSKQIKKAIRKIKKEENVSLGKVFIDDSLKNYNLQFSGRASKEISLSGEYLTPGSKIPFKDILGEDKILRIGVAWKGDESCDIDHSLNLLNKDRSVYYGNPTYMDNNKNIIISSSGDITSNSNDLYSVELIDIDIDKVKELDIGNMVSSLIQYHGMTLNNYEILWFMNIIDKKDRIINSQKVHMNVDQMQYAIQINHETNSMLGFYINLEKDELEVLNIPIATKNFTNSENMAEKFKQALLNRPELIETYEAVKKVIKKSQFVDTIEEADVVISANKISSTKEVEFIHPGRNGERINSIVF